MTVPCIIQNWCPKFALIHYQNYNMLTIPFNQDALPCMRTLMEMLGTTFSCWHRVTSQFWNSHTAGTLGQLWYCRWPPHEYLGNAFLITVLTHLSLAIHNNVPMCWYSSSHFTRPLIVKMRYLRALESQRTQGDCRGGYKTKGYFSVLCRDITTWLINC